MLTPAPTLFVLHHARVFTFSLTMNGNYVSLDFRSCSNEPEPDSTHHLAYWPASHIPINPEFSVQPNTTGNKCKILARDIICFDSDEACNDNVRYFIAKVDRKNRLVCRPSKLHRMLPNYEFKDLLDDESNEATRLTRKEQLDEVKEKFGSRKSQRDLASKRKYQIQFGEDDVDNLPSIKKSLEEDNEESKESTQQALSSVLPQRNPDAKKASEVYSISDIITLPEESAILEYEEQLFSGIKTDYFKELASKLTPDDKQSRTMLIYADLLLQLVKLPAADMRKADPLPEVVGDVKKHIFERYTSTKHCSTRSMRYVVTDLNKDRIFVYIIILTLAVNDYKPIELKRLEKCCNKTTQQMRRILELIGCYIDSHKNVNGLNVKVAHLRIPLNVFKEPKAKRHFGRK